jgi:hypothetical protein
MPVVRARGVDGYEYEYENEGTGENEGDEYE